MAMVKDIMLDDDNDLLFTSGDMTVKESDQQHVILLLNYSPGDLKLSPFVGVGIIRFVSSSGQQQTLKRIIEVQMQADGFTKPDVIMKGNVVYSLSAERVNV